LYSSLSTRITGTNRKPTIHATTHPLGALWPVGSPRPATPPDDKRCFSLICAEQSRSADGTAKASAKTIRRRRLSGPAVVGPFLPVDVVNRRLGGITNQLVLVQ
jgi:hypothetical protein